MATQCNPLPDSGPEAGVGCARSRRRRQPLCLPAVLALAVLAAGCNGGGNADGGAPTGPWPHYDLTAAASLTTHPYPSSVRFTDGQAPLLDDLPNPAGVAVVERLKAMVHDRSGAGLTAGLQLVFAAEPDRRSWPRTATASAAADSPIALVELTVEGEPSGRRIPLRWRYFRRGGTFHAPNTLRLVPDYGFALEPASRYALLIRAGAGVEASPEMADLLAGRSPSGALGERAAERLGEALDELAGLGVATDDLVFLHPFATDDPAADLHAIVADTVERQPAPPLAGFARTRNEPEFCLLEGTVAMPQFQAGTPPFFEGGGHWVADGAGHLIRQRTEQLPVAVVVPKGTMPAGGWPLVVYVHGTAGLSTQVIDRGPTPPGPGELPAEGGSPTTRNRGPGWVLAQRGIASAGTALPVNPQRVPEALGWGIYNFPFPTALRDNFRQGALEQALFLRALAAASFDPARCPGSDASAAADGRLRFDVSRVGAMGQSLGAIELGLWAPTEPMVGAVVPSGAGGLYALMITTSTIIPGELVLRALAAMNANEPASLLHPLGMLVQMAIEPVDPVALASRTTRSPVPAVGAKHVYAPTGYLDGFFMPGSINALMGPLGVEQAGAEQHPSLPKLLRRLDRPAAAYPVSANVAGPDGAYTSVAVQYLQDDVLDGHHVSYQQPGPKHQYGCFFRTYFDRGIPAVPAPGAVTAPCP